MLADLCSAQRLSMAQAVVQRDRRPAGQLLDQANIRRREGAVFARAPQKDGAQDAAPSLQGRPDDMTDGDPRSDLGRRALVAGGEPVVAGVQRQGAAPAQDRREVGRRGRVVGAGAPLSKQRLPHRIAGPHDLLPDQAVLAEERYVALVAEFRHQQFREGLGDGLHLQGGVRSRAGLGKEAQRPLRLCLLGDIRRKAHERRGRLRLRDTFFWEGSPSAGRERGVREGVADHVPVLSAEEVATSDPTSSAW